MLNNGNEKDQSKSNGIFYNEKQMRKIFFCMMVDYQEMIRLILNRNHILMHRKSDDHG